MDVKSKRCTECKEVRLPSAFSKNHSAKDGLDHRCKICMKKYLKKYHSSRYQSYDLKIVYNKHRSKTCKACGKSFPRTRAFWNRSNSSVDGLNVSCVRCMALSSNYGATSEEIDLLYKKQKGSCSICKRPHALRYLHVDHDHAIYYKKRDGLATREQRRRSVRGLLCSPCNKSLGWYEIVNLFLPSQWEVAKEYLTNPPAKGILWE